MTTRSIAGALLAAAAVLSLAGCAANGDVSAPQSGHARILSEAQAAAAEINTPEKAWAAGYRPDHYCIPGMGVHWIHKPGQPDSYFDDKLDPARPEVVLFLPDSADLSDTSGDRFLGIEYVVVTPEGAEPPVLHGVKFYGPMAGHTPDMPWHSELHVYLRDGTVSDKSFPETTPEAVCPPGTTPPG